MEVQGDRVTGSGTTFYQFALPLARNSLDRHAETNTLKQYLKERQGGQP